jgi:acyl carrier protein
MPDLDARLVRCFSSVFADLPPEEIRAASAESLSAWDSLAAVTLIAVLQQEFGLQIALADYPKLKSFQAIELYIRSRNGAGQNGAGQTKTHSPNPNRESQ